MKNYPSNNWNFAAIMDSSSTKYKYEVILQNKATNSLAFINFGKTNKLHYKDTTGLNTYAYMDHNNLEKRRIYILNKTFDIRAGYFNETYFEMKYLYSFDYFLINSSI